jgi:hypothetical protein
MDDQGSLLPKSNSNPTNQDTFTQHLAQLSIELNILNEAIDLANELIQKRHLSETRHIHLLHKYMQRKHDVEHQVQYLRDHQHQLHHLQTLEATRAHLIKSHQDRLQELTITIGDLKQRVTEVVDDFQPQEESEATTIFETPSPTRRQNLWQQYSLDPTYAWGCLLTCILVGWTVTTPQYVMSVLPNTPLTPIFLSVAFGILVAFGQLFKGFNRPKQRILQKGFLYSILVWGPFVTTWIVTSRIGLPVWLSAIPAISIPSVLLLLASQRNPSTDQTKDPLLVLIPLSSYHDSALTLLSSLFYGYGTLLLAIFMYTTVSGLSFGLLIITNIGVLLPFGAILAGGLFGYCHVRK